MALNLQDFNKPSPTQELRMDAFQPKEAPSPAANKSTINTVASYGAALAADGDVDSAYRSITNQLSYSASSTTLDTILKQWNDNDIRSSMDSVKEMLIDPNLDDKQKQDILYGFQTGQLNNSLASKVALSSAIATSEGENGEQEDLRTSIASGFNDVDNYNSWVQKSINALQDQANPTWVDNVKGMVASIVPFADPAFQASFEGMIDSPDVGGIGNTVGTLVLLGENKDRLRDTLARVPIEQRKPIVEGIIKTIKSSMGPSTDNGLALKQIAIMQQMLTPGSYDNPERWADNTFSIMDDTILLAPFGKAVRGLRAGVKAVSGGRVAEEVIARGERVVEAANDAPLMIEYKPSPVSYGDDIESVIDTLPIEPTSSQIKEVRQAIYNQLDNPQGFNIDSVIDQLSITDNMTASQINEVRGTVGRIRDKRVTDLNNGVAVVQPSIVDVQKMHISSNVQPTAITEIYKHTNPSKARMAHNAIVADETGQTATILAGTTRDNALANDYLGEIGGTSDKGIKAKLEYDEPTATPDPTIIRNSKDGDGAIWADKAEKAELQDRVIKEWKNTIGVSNRSAMASLSDLKLETNAADDGLRIKQVYGPKDGGFSNANTGVDVVKAALRKYGITDSEVTVLALQPNGRYAPLTSKQPRLNGNFLIQVNHDYKFDPKDIGYNGFDISPLWGFIKVPDIAIPGFNVKQGGIVQQALPKSVITDIRAYGAGVSAADRAAGVQKQLLEYGKRISDTWRKLPKAQQAKVDEYIRMANDNEITFNVAKIRGRGIDDDGVQLLMDWKTVQDTLYYFENQDVNRTLRQRGYEMFEHRASDTNLIVEPQARASNVYGTRFYDAETGNIRTFTNAELDKLYAEGGTTARLRNPENFNGETIDQVIVKNTPDGGFNRRIRDEDATLNYRDGYYHVRYTDPYFVTMKDSDGSTRTIARAQTRRDAELEAQRLNETKDGKVYDWKHDRNDNVDATFDNNLNVAFSSGRSSQRLRGKRLQRVGNDKTVGDMGLESPIDSLTRSISSIATRTSFRNTIEASKRRWMGQFKHLLPAGPPKFPNDIGEIRAGKGASDARHAYRYISGLQDGYANLIDDASKAFFNKVSDTAGSKGWAWVDKLSRQLATKSPSAAARLTAFRLFLAANPLGQLPLQAFPAIPIISSLNPLGWGNVIRQAGILGAFHRGVDVTTTMKVAKYAGLKVEDMQEVVKDYQLSGMSAAVNAHSYLSDDLGKLADRNIVQRGLSILGKPLKVAQEIGFDFGEQTLMSLVWLSERDRLTRRLGTNKLTSVQREELSVRVRAMTGDMNKGGEMPYNSNTFSVIMQFLQSPHKIASGLILGHKGLTGSERARLATGYTLAFGIPGIPIINSFVDKIIPPDKPEVNDVIKGGLVNILFNRFLSSMSGEDVNVDFAGRLQPFNLTPMTDFVHGLFTNSVPEMLSGSAAPSLLSDGGRVGEFVKAVMAPFTPGNYEGVDEYKQVGLTFLQMFTGLSNGMKAHYMLELGKITTRTGQSVDDDVSFMEALMKAGGFQTMDEVRYWQANKLQWEASDRIDEDIKGLVDNLFVKYTRQGEDVTDTEQYIKIMSEASRVFNNNPVFMEKIADYYQFKTRQDPDALYRTLFKNSGLYSPEDVVQIINNSNFSQDQIDTLMAMYNMTGESYGR